MRKWFAIVGASVVVGYAAVYFVLSGLTPSEPEAEQPTATAPQASEPVVLSQVVDVTNLDPLLEPLPGQPAGIPFDPTEPLEPVNTKPSLTPTEAPNTDVAPVPHEASVRPPLDAPRVMWYGDEVFHKQLYDWLRNRPDQFGNGIALFF